MSFTCNFQQNISLFISKQINFLYFNSNLDSQIDRNISKRKETILLYSKNYHYSSFKTVTVINQMTAELNL